jgi:hypothetical protein
MALQFEHVTLASRQKPMRILAFILVAHALSAIACEESFIMGTLPDGTSTNMTRRITIPAYSELKLNVYAFGSWIENGIRDNPPANL